MSDRQGTARLFIAFDGGPSKQPAEWHWAFVLTDGGYPSMHTPSLVYQIQNEDGGRDSWKAKHGACILGDLGAFQGVVELPACNDTTVADVQNVLEGAPVLPQNIPALVREQWNCALWIIDILMEYGPIWGMDLDGTGAESNDYRKLGVYILGRSFRLREEQEGTPEIQVTADGLRIVSFQ
ncbi:hypothetical protein K474DRAFT_1466023 [Panus rudis PR-1116 ss-1]|nr:hypothetical protein K474DRAFT_1466023 [Panus rudis PR-1116 ss-1]